ncbi:hypothetical protein BJ875DRAFT_470951 [Amylocarpus encephaloides]|uniref:DUF6536 domain-containing protein n=1 Tax=Amylocarpus encephaloides TaxID=45428 RepID=A0A9P8C2G6_9HELO|nr:hypothetical protein BJ875DRAFT_470951 [Amylocarpus encephaloides]
MSGRGLSQDQEGLLQYAEDMPKSPPSRTRPSTYEIRELDSIDISSYRASHPPLYQALVDQEDASRDGHFRGDSIDKYSSSSRQNRPSSHNSTRPAVHNWFMRFVLRSGRYISYQSANTKHTESSNSHSGWRGGCIAACVAAGTVLLLNLAFSITAAVISQSGMHIGELFEGDCEMVSRADSALHLAINIMGTILLGASNYTMQCISAPTRAEVSRQHSRGRYLDIGLPSIRNLHGRKKKILFTLLVVSTMPLHFLWNSAVFKTTQKMDYKVNVVTPAFLTTPTVDCAQNASVFHTDSSMKKATYYSWASLTPNATSLAMTGRSPSWFQRDACSNAQGMLANYTHEPSLLQKLNNKDCIKHYGSADTAVSGYGHVLAVTKDQLSISNNTILLEFNYQQYVSNYTGNNWVCDSKYVTANNYRCRPQDIEPHSWTLGRFKASPTNKYQIVPTEQYEIDYCLALPTQYGGKCQLQYSMVIMIFVLVANATKFVCICVVVKTSHEPVLATVGDAVASFLERPDRIMVDQPFLTRKKATQYTSRGATVPRKWTKQHAAYRWWQGPSMTRWVVTLGLCLIAIILVGGLLNLGNSSFVEATSRKNVPASPYSIGFGVYSEYAVLNVFGFNQFIKPHSFSSTKYLLSMVAVANIPQFVVSSLYFAYNTVYTSMVSADEWSRFTTTRKSLRVTRPIGIQRSTYWLSLPWTYSLPLSVSSTVIHYLISQSLFVARTEVLTPSGEVEAISFMQVGYSPLAILLALLFGCLMVAAMIANGFRKLRPCVLVGNSSLAIAAACQRPEWENEAHLKQVQWGAVRQPTLEQPGHCTFTSGEVEEPWVGSLYI